MTTKKLGTLQEKSRNGEEEKKGKEEVRKQRDQDQKGEKKNV